MPITITLPNGTTVNIGPGALVEAHTDQFGPWPVDTFWETTVIRVDPASEDYVIRQRYEATSSILRIFLGEPGTENPRNNGTGRETVAMDAPVRLRVSMQTPSTGFYEQAEIETPWDQNAAAINNLIAIGSVPNSAEVVGFSGNDRQLLEEIWAAVHRTFSTS